MCTCGFYSYESHRKKTEFDYLHHLRKNHIRFVGLYLNIETLTTAVVPNGVHITQFVLCATGFQVSVLLNRARLYYDVHVRRSLGETV